MAPEEVRWFLDQRALWLVLRRAEFLDGRNGHIWREGTDNVFVTEAFVAKEGLAAAA
jgi:hypothetical protein